MAETDSTVLLRGMAETIIESNMADLTFLAVIIVIIVSCLLFCCCLSRVRIKHGDVEKTSSPSPAEEKPPNYEDLEKQPPPSFDEWRRNVSIPRLIREISKDKIWGRTKSVEQIKDFFWL